LTVSNRWPGLIVALVIAAGVAGVLLFNLESSPRIVVEPPQVPAQPPAATAAPVPTAAPGAAPFREYPIGEEAERNHMTIAAVWLPSVHLAGAGEPGGGVIHLEADVHATEGNPNGFALDEFVPYLTIQYTIEPSSGGAPITGTMLPMVARDGLHYGASVAMPGPGTYRLTYHIEPPSTNGLGRHDDPETGVQPWWEPFEVSFDWDFQPPTGD
jgi:uncharacterized protein involved in high-affinity Fe2+ transport